LFFLIQRNKLAAHYQRALRWNFRDGGLFVLKPGLIDNGTTTARENRNNNFITNQPPARDVFKPLCAPPPRKG
jgi:hypothetical protein